MSATLVPTVKTTITLNDLILGLIEGWMKQFNETPSKESIGVLYSQNALETGNTVSMYNYNLGNVKYIPSSGDDDNIEYIMLNNVWEIEKGVKVFYQPPNKQTWFRSFPTLADGVAHHLDFLKNHRYKNAWLAVESGNPAMFSRLLKISGYYTAPEADYSRLMCYYFNKYMKETVYEDGIASLAPAPIPEPEPVIVPPADISEDKSPPKEDKYKKIINILSMFSWSNFFIKK